MNCNGSGYSLEERTPNERFQEALRAFQDLDIQRAYDHVQCAIRQDPDQAEYHLLKAKLFENSGNDRRAAIMAYEAALKLQPNNAEIMLRLAPHLQAEGMQVRATALIQKAREIAPAHPLLKRLDSVSAPAKRDPARTPRPAAPEDLGQQVRTLFNKILGKVVDLDWRESVGLR